MTDGSSDFKFSTDEPDPDELFHEELRDLRVEKLSQRLTLLAILLPCLLGVAIFFAYRDLASRVIRSQDSGSVEFQKLSRALEDLSKEFNDKIITFSTTLSSQDKAFEASFRKKLAAINTRMDALNGKVTSLNKQFTQTGSALKKLDAAKADKKEQAAAIARITASLKPLTQQLQSLGRLREDVKATSSALKTLESSVKKEVGALAAAVRKIREDLDQLQVLTNRLSDLKSDVDTIYLELFKVKKNYQNLKSRLDALQQQIDDLSQLSRSYRQPARSAPKPKTSMKATTSRTAGAHKKAAPAPSDTFEEKDLVE